MHKLSWELVLSQLTHIRSLKIIWLLELESHDLYSTTITKMHLALENLSWSTSLMPQIPPFLTCSTVRHPIYAMSWSGVSGLFGACHFSGNLQTWWSLVQLAARNWFSQSSQCVGTDACFSNNSNYITRLPKYTRQHIFCTHKSTSCSSQISLTTETLAKLPIVLHIFMSHLDLPEGVNLHMHLSDVYRESQTLIASPSRHQGIWLWIPDPRRLWNSHLQEGQDGT